MDTPFPSLYERYADDVDRLTERVGRQHRSMQHAGYRTTLADIEGELLYLLVRDRRPSVVFEVSPDAGYSTNYLLAGVTDNAHGTVHSFEIAERIGRRPIEAVVRGNQHPDLDQGRLVLHRGDARETTKDVDGDIDLLLVDSCHEDWFAEWYVAELVPRVQGVVMIQDIAFVDQLEPSSEARYVWRWLHENGIRFELVGAIERALADARLHLPERRRLRSNAVLLDWPPVLGAPTAPPELDGSPTDTVARAASAASAGDAATARRLLARAGRQLSVGWARAGRHRDYLEMARIARDLGDREEARTWIERAAIAAQEGSRQERISALAEVTPVAARRGALHAALNAIVAGAGDLSYWRRLAQVVRRAKG